MCTLYKNIFLSMRVSAFISLDVSRGVSRLQIQSLFYIYILRWRNSIKSNTFMSNLPLYKNIWQYVLECAKKDCAHCTVYSRGSRFTISNCAHCTVQQGQSIYYIKLCILHCTVGAVGLLYQICTLHCTVGAVDLYQIVHTALCTVGAVNLLYQICTWKEVEYWGICKCKINNLSSFLKFKTISSNLSP